MVSKKEKFEKATTKLISVIRKEWHKELGEPGAKVTELVMDKAQELLSAAKDNKVPVILNGLSLTQFLGETWVRKHPGVNQCIAGFEAMLKDEASR
jgi:hypothetical protein